MKSESRAQNGKCGHVCFSRAFAFVPHIAPFRSNIDNIDPNQRIFPSEHTADPTCFAGTLLSAVDLVWFPEKDHASKSDYADWLAGSIGELPPPQFGIHQYINDVVPGYFVKLDSSELKKYAVLHVYRPLKSTDGEPEIVVLEIDVKTEKFVQNATPKSIEGEHIIEIGGGANSLCMKVVQWLKAYMGKYFNGRTHRERDGARSREGALHHEGDHEKRDREDEGDACTGAWIRRVDAPPRDLRQRSRPHRVLDRIQRPPQRPHSAASSTTARSAVPTGPPSRRSRRSALPQSTPPPCSTSSPAL